MIMITRVIIGIGWAVICCLYTPRLSAQPSISISTDFPGGNVKVDSISGTTVYFRPHLRDTGRDWFYWYFTVSSTTSDSVRFVLTRKDCLSKLGPAFSKDQGQNWDWLWETPQIKNEFVYYLKAGEKVRLSMGVPYLQQNLDGFLQSAGNRRLLKQDQLCTTPQGRVLEKLIITSPRSKAKKARMLITARHHACEAMTSYVLEGLMAELLSRDKAMRRLLKKVEFWIIPFVDKDGVENGDQGKGRLPHDHNRDYSGSSLYASTAALREEFKNNVVIALDIHCPMLRGKSNEIIYLLGATDERMAHELVSFAGCLAGSSRGALQFDKQEIRVSETTALEGMMFAQWAATLPGNRLAATLEIPYALHKQEPIMPENARLFGRDLAHSIRNYWESTKAPVQE